MIRLLLLALLVPALVSCGTSVRQGGDPTPQETEDEVVAVARDVLPALGDALGVKPPRIPMSFTERGGFGIYDYDGAGQFQGVEGTVAQVRRRLARAVSAAGLTIEESTDLEDVRATRGNVMVRLEVLTLGADAPDRLVQLDIGTIRPISADEDEVGTGHPDLRDLIAR